MSKRILILAIRKNSDGIWTFSSNITEKEEIENHKSQFIRVGMFNESISDTIYVSGSSNKAEISDVNNFILTLRNYCRENKSVLLSYKAGSNTSFHIEFWDYSDRIKSGYTNLSELISYNKDYLSRIENIFNKNNLHCEICRGYTNELNAVTDSMGQEYKACVNCSRTKICIICKNRELINSVKYKISIDNEGNIEGGRLSGSNHLCTKCCSSDSSYLRCGKCGSYYDKIRYSRCPCSIPHDFKKMIQPYNADVTHTHSADVFSIELFGIEIETGVLYKQREKYEEVYNQTYELVKNDAIMVYDSRIDYLDGSQKKKPSNYRGMEIVTRPMIYKNALRFLKKFSKNRHPLLKSWEVGTAGIHIHTSKAALSRIQIGKLGLFINDKKNRELLKLIAKRENKKYAKYLTRKLTDYADNSHECHYYALNTSKPNTIEIRIFRGTLNLDTLISYLQFFKSLIDFIKLAPNGVASSSEENNLYYKDYIDWLMTTEKSRFRELKNRIKKELTDNIIIEEGEI